MKKYSKKIITLLTFVVTILACTASAFATTPTPTTISGNTYSDTLSTAAELTFTNTRQVSVPTNASYPTYIFIALAALSAAILFITIKQRRATHD